VFGPTSLYLSARDNDDLGLLAAAAAVAVMFAGTPFVLDDVARSYGVSLGAAGLIATAQVAGFAITTFVAGRRFRTSHRFLVWGALVAAAFNGLSAMAPTFPILLAARTVAGAGAGLLVWLSWAKAMRSSLQLRSVAAVGPFTILVFAPILSWTAEAGGASAVFWLTGAVFLPVLGLPASFSGFRLNRSSLSPSRSNVVLVFTLGIMTLSANGLWVYAVVIGEQLVGLSPFVVSLAFSGNALAGFIAARIPAKAIPPRVWLFGIALAAAAVAYGNNPFLYLSGVVSWGFFFWMATPAILRSIAVWSVAPEERVGDAQSAMAVGRAVGPAVAGMIVGDGAFGTLGAFSVTGILLAAFMAYGVSNYRRTRVPPQERMR